VDHLGRVISAFYYEFFFDTRSRLSTAMAARVQVWEQRRRQGDVPIPKTLWEQQYQTGHWNFLRTLGELGRFSLVVGYIHELKPHSALLDVGCGEGLLFKRLQPRGCARYLGLDISAAAVARACEVGDGPFICADAEQYVPSETYDVIVFNESLYYFNKPLETVDRYFTRLSTHGIMIVSTFPKSRRGRSILRALKRKYVVLDETHISHASESWICSVFTASTNAASPKRG
jgi:2-polyprenyl-3-methyl-5-hydroxy-6-metoxy-1,4-benzoquinol methylase